MANQPNRKARVAESPPPELIAETRHGALQTQAEAASIVYATVRTWQDWEAGRRRMPLVAWEVYLLHHCMPGGVLQPTEWRRWLRSEWIAALV